MDRLTRSNDLSVETMIFTGNANLKLAADVAKNLFTGLGRATVTRFSDGEIAVEIFLLNQPFKVVFKIKTANRAIMIVGVRAIIEKVNNIFF